MTIQFDGTAGIVTTGNITANNFFGNFAGDLRVPGSNTDVIFNDSGFANGVSTLQFDKVSNVLTVTGNIEADNIIAPIVNVTTELIANSLQTTGNAFIGGDLTVSGNVSFIDINKIQTEDPMIVLGVGPNGAPLTSNDGKDRGVQMDYYSDSAFVQQSAFMGWVNTTGNMIAASNVSITNDVVTVNQWGTFEAGDIVSDTLSLVGVANVNDVNSSGNIVPTADDTYSLGNSTNQWKDLWVSGNTIYMSNVPLTMSGTTLEVNGIPVVTNGGSASNVVISGNLTVDGDSLNGSNSPFNLLNTGVTEINFGSDATTINIGAPTGVTTINNDLSVSGDTTLSNATVSGNLDISTDLAVTGDTTLSDVVITGNLDVNTDLAVTGDTTLSNATVSGNLDISTDLAVTGDTTLSNATVSGNLDISTDLAVTGDTTLSELAVTGNSIVSGNVLATGILTDNYYYANGVPVDFEQPAGANTQVQFNDNQNFGASPNFTFNQVTNTLDVTGNVTTGILTATTIGGSLTTNAQPNITSVGTLVSLAVTGNTATGGILTDNYYYANGTPVDFERPAGANTELQFNNNQNFGASPNLTFDAAANVLTVGGNIVSNNLSVGNNITGSNLSVANLSATNSASVNSMVVTNAIVVGGDSLFEGNIAGNLDMTIAGNITVSGNINLTGNVTEITGNTGVFYGEVPTGFKALYAGISSGFANLDQTVLQGSGNFNGFIQINYQNINAGQQASTDFVATADNGNNEAYYINMGITSSTWDGSEPNSFGNAVFQNDGYLYTQDGNMVIGTPSTGKVTKIVTGGAGTDYQVATFNPGGTESTSSTTGALVLLGGLGVASNINAPNIYSTNSFAATANVTTVLNSANIKSTNIYGDSLTISSNIANITLNPAVIVSLNNKRISDLADPTSNQDAATKIYVDQVAQGLSVKQSCVVATAAVLPAYNYFNGASGVGATITGLVPGALSIDGVAVQTGFRVLIKNESGASAIVNGIYVVTAAGDGSTQYVLTRSSDFDNTPSGEIAGAFTFISSGSVNADSGWVCTTNNPVVLGTTQITFSQFSGAGSYSAGSGMSLTGTVFSVNVDPETTTVNGSNQIAVKASANLVTPNIGNAVGNTLSMTGNISAANLLVTNSVISSTLVSNVATGTAPLTVTSTTRVANLNVGHANVSDFASVTSQSTGVYYPTFVGAAGTSNYALASNTVLSFNTANGLLNTTLLGGVLTTAAQPNVTSVGTLTTLNVTGNATTGNLSTGIIQATGNITGGANISVAGNVIAGGFSTTGNASIQGNLIVSGTLSAISLDFTDPVLGLGRGANGSALSSNDGKDRGIQLYYYQGPALSGVEKQAFMGWDNSTNKMIIAEDATVSALDIVTVNNYGTIVLGAVEAATGAFTGNVTTGNISGTTGAFTSVTGSGAALTSLNASNISSGTLDQARLANSTITVNGTTLTLGGTSTVTANAETLTGTSLNSTVVSSSLTSVGTLGSLAVTGNVTTGNVSGTTGAFTSVTGSGAALTSLNASNISSGTLDQARLANSTMTVNGSTLTLGATSTITAAAGTLTGTTLNSTVVSSSLTSVGTLGSLAVSGTTTSGTVQTTSLTTGAVGTGGTITGVWTLNGASRMEATYADLAERYTSDEQYEPGTIVMIGGEQEVTVADYDGRYRLAGIVSTAPAYVLNSTIQNSVIIALVGRVPCRVRGKINKGDLITISDVPGVGTAIPAPAHGVVVGRALQSYDSDEIGVIEIKVDQC